MLIELQKILNGGRQFAGTWGKYIRTVDKKGFYRIYEETADGFKFLRSARTKKDGSTYIREKVFPGAQPQTATVSREYTNSGTRICTELEKNKYRVSSDLKLRDGDISNLGGDLEFMDRHLGVHDEGCTTIIKDYRGTNQPGYYKDSNGCSIFGIETDGNVTRGLHDRWLSFEEIQNIISKYAL